MSEGITYQEMAELEKENHQNKVELVGHYGGDKAHALSAWTSTTRSLSPEKEARIPGLLQMLASNQHETPFEKSTIHFLVTTEIATHIQIIKHRIGVSFNGESARYKELKEDKFYVPQDWPAEEVLAYCEHLYKCIDLYHATYKRLLDKGFQKARAKESARLYLPYGNQLQADVMFNFRSFHHFLKLRYSTHAQAEIRALARKMLEQVDALGDFEHSLVAFKLKDAQTGKLCEPFT